MKNILIIKDDYNSYLTLLGCVMQKRKINKILQIVSKKGPNLELIGRLNVWLKEKRYPKIRTDLQTIDVIEIIEKERNFYYQEFPSKLFHKIENTSGLLAECDSETLNLTPCLCSWGWDDEEVTNLVLNLSELPVELEEMIETVPLPLGNRPLIAS